MIPWTAKKTFTSGFALTFLLRNRCSSSLDMLQVRVARRSGAFFVFKRCQRPAGGRGDYHRHRFQNANFAQSNATANLVDPGAWLRTYGYVWNEKYVELLHCLLIRARQLYLVV